MNDAIKRLSVERGNISDTDIAAIYDAHLATHRHIVEAEKTSASVIAEIDEVMDMLHQLALGSTAKYGQSSLLSNDLAGPDRPLQGPRRHRLDRQCDEGRRLDQRDPRRAAEGDQERDRDAARNAGGGPHRIADRRAHRRVEPQALRGTLIARSTRRQDRSPLALIVIDIDHFKRFNDTYGHLTGDQVLKLVGMTMREVVKSKATLARFGGEEFAIILPDTTMQPARALADTIRQSVMSRELVKRSTGEIARQG